MTTSDPVPATATTAKVSMSPWSNYTFRVLARSQAGDSRPSAQSEVCLTPEDVPYHSVWAYKGSLCLGLYLYSNTKALLC